MKRIYKEGTIVHLTVPRDVIETDSTKNRNKVYEHKNVRPHVYFRIRGILKQGEDGLPDSYEATLGDVSDIYLSDRVRLFILEAKYIKRK